MYDARKHDLRLWGRSASVEAVDFAFFSKKMTYASSRLAWMIPSCYLMSEKRDEDDLIRCFDSACIHASSSHGHGMSESSENKTSLSPTCSDCSFE